MGDQMTFEKMPWTAEHRLEADEARMLGRKFFNFPCDKVVALEEGWHYINFLADNEWVLRFPEREHCSKVSLREKEVHDLLEKMPLPLPTPNIKYLAGPSENFLWHFAAYRYVRGTPLLGVQDSKVPSHIPESIGEFLAILHEASAKVDIEDPWGDEDDDNWTRRKFEASLLAYPVKLRVRTDSFLELPTPSGLKLPRVLTHGDLNAEHILVDQSTGKVSGIIDWADTHTSFRSRDFVGLYYFGDKECARQAYNAYGAEPDDDEWRWLKHAAIEMCIGQIFYGWNDNKPTMVEEGLKRVRVFLN